jgi:hypothetical protein
LLTASSEKLERRQALQDVEQVRAHQAQGLPLPLRQIIRRFADQDHEQGNERPGDEEDERRQEIHRRDKDKEEERNEDGEKELRQVLAEIGLKRLDSFARGVGQLAGPFLARKGRTECIQLRHHPPAHVSLDPRGDLERGDFAGPGHGRAREQDHQERDEGRPHGSQRVPCDQNARDDMAQRPGLSRDKHARNHSEQDGEEKHPAGVREQTQQTLIQVHHRNRKRETRCAAGRVSRFGRYRIRTLTSGA